MSSILPLIFSLVFLVACGKHDQSSFGTQGVANTIQVESAEELSQNIMEEDTLSLEKFIKNGGDINTELKSGRTLLTEACFWAKIKVIDLLVAHKADLELKDRSGKSPADYGHDDIKIKRALYPELIIELKVALIRAAKNMTELKKILEENPPVNFFFGKELGDEFAAFEGETLLTYLVKNKMESALRLLAQPKYELDVNLANKQGEKPLTLSIQLNFKNIEKLLVKLGATE